MDDAYYSYPYRQERQWETVTFDNLNPNVFAFLMDYWGIQASYVDDNKTGERILRFYSPKHHTAVTKRILKSQASSTKDYLTVYKVMMLNTIREIMEDPYKKIKSSSCVKERNDNDGSK